MNILDMNGSFTVRFQTMYCAELEFSVNVKGISKKCILKKCYFLWSVLFAPESL